MPPSGFPRHAIRVLAVRSALLWVLVHALVVLLSYLRQTSEGLDGVGVPTVTPNPLWIVTACLVLGIIEVRRRGERALWENLALSPSHLAIVFASTAALGELLLAITHW